MIILGISCFYHDSAAALVIDGVPVAMAEEERFSRKKHDFSFPEKAINFVLKKGGIKPCEVDYAVFFEKPFLKLERAVETSLRYFPISAKNFIKSMKGFFIDKIWIREKISRFLGISQKKVLFSYHHLSHAASSFFSSPFNSAAILTVDGVGEWTTTAISIGYENKIKIIEEIYFPHSLGLFYSTITAFLGFEVNEGEYKVMGLSAFGEPKFDLKKIIRVYNDASFELDMRYFSFHHSEIPFSRKFIELFGEPRDKRDWKIMGKDIMEKDKYYADLAASFQRVLEEILIKLARRAYEVTGEKRLCLAGGVALNSVANWKIRKNSPFEEIFIQPAAGDAGGALGAALLAYMELGERRKFHMNHVFWGEDFSEKDIIQEIEKRGLKYKEFNNEDKLLDFTVDRIISGKVVGWFQGRFEWGPRALGARSILADPRKEEMKDIVNKKVKFREPFRPFAPACLIEKASEFFDVEPEKEYPTRFMLYALPVRKHVPATTHVDGTARIQVVSPETTKEEKIFYKLIKRFEKATGTPLLLNTSFNIKGEQIVASPSHAINTFAISGIDTLIIENFALEKPK